MHCRNVTDLLDLTSKKLSDKHAIWSIQHRYKMVSKPKEDCIIYGGNEYNIVDANLQDERGYTALMLGSRFGRGETVKMLLTTPFGGIDVNLQNKNGFTALMLASRYDGEEIIRMLLTPLKSHPPKGCIDVNLQDKYGYTALMWASIYGEEKIVRILLAYAPLESSEMMGIDVNLQNTWVKTALMYASINGHKEIVRMLEEAS